MILMGHRKTPEKQLEHLAGHRHSRPVRVGNAAWTQIQLDSYGELIDAVYRFDEKERLLDCRTRRMLRELGHYVCRHWSEPDQGIWEIPLQRPAPHPLEGHVLGGAGPAGEARRRGGD